MKRRFVSIRSKLLILIGCFLFSLIVMMSSNFYFDTVRQAMDIQHEELLARRDRADRILQLVNIMQNNLYKVVYQGSVALQSKILVENEDLLIEFEEFTTASQQTDLDEDYFFLRENETALLHLRAVIFKVVSLMQAGEQQQARQLMVQNVEPGVLHIKTYVELASEIRRLKILDYYVLKQDLDDQHQLLRLFMATFFLIIGIVIALYVARSIARPIESITKQIQALDPGDAHLSIILSSGSNDEAAILTSAFNELLTAHQRATDSSREHEQLAANLLNSAGEAIYGIDLKGECTFANRSCLKLLGNQSEEELLGKNMHVLIHHTHNDGTPYPVEECKIFKAFKERISSHVDDEVLWRADGSSFDSEYRSFPMYDRDEIIGSVVSFTDISERKVLERERERTGAELAQLIDTANAPIFGVDLHGKVNEWNRTVAKLTGYEKGQVMGQDLVENFVAKGDKKSVKRVLDNALMGTETANYEFSLNTKDGGRHVELLLNATSRRDLDGNITGVIGIGQDVTDLRQKETALRQAQKMEAVGQLTGGIAHDFNNLLSIIRGNLRFLQQDIPDVNTGIEELFEDAMSAVDDGAELTQRLLAISGSRSLQSEIRNVNDAIEKFARFLSRTLAENIELEFDLPDEDLFIDVDPSQLENSLLNLSLNARDAMPDGGRITFSATRYHHSDAGGVGPDLPGDGDYVLIAVTDTGTGINSEDLQHVYEPFFTTKEVGKGSGLGLSMVYGFMQLSNGVSTISSESGKGTTVSMYFPEVVGEVGKAGVITEQAPAGGSEVILVVEDEIRVRRVTLRDLKHLGYNTLEAENAAMAKAIIESREEIDLLFSDILMPGKMNGHMLAIWTKKHFPNIKVVLTSGFSKVAADVNKDDAHSFPLIRKPYSVGKLAEQIKATLEGSNQKP